MNKKCFKCGKKKPIRLFYKHPMMGDGHLGKCIACTKKDVAERYVKSRDKIVAYEKLRFKDPKRKAKIREYRRNRRKNHPRKTYANYWVANAIRDGRLIRKPCEVCGEVKSQAHHDDYRKYASVRWLCFKHHREAHGQTVSQ